MHPSFQPSLFSISYSLLQPWQGTYKHYPRGATSLLTTQSEFGLSFHTVGNAEWGVVEYLADFFYLSTKSSVCMVCKWQWWMMSDIDWRLQITSRSIISLGKGTSGFSPVSTVGMLAFLISFSTNPVQQRQSIIQNLSNFSKPSSLKIFQMRWKKMSLHT